MSLPEGNMIVTEPSALQTTNLSELIEGAVAAHENARSPSTRRARATDWNRFAEWCESNELVALPADPGTVAIYLVSMARDGYKAASIGRHISSISVKHKEAGYDPSPTSARNVLTTWRGIRREIGTASEGKAPLMMGDIRSMVEEVDRVMTGKKRLTGLRDRAVLLLGFSGGFRRSEIVALDVDDLAFGERGVTVTVRRSKTDQEGEGMTKGIPFGSRAETCPIEAIRAWLDEASVEDGALFRQLPKGGLVGGRLSGRAVAEIVKRWAAAIGMDDRLYSGHSLRAGFVTQAAINGASTLDIKRQTGHRSDAMIEKYYRPATVFTNNAADVLGL